MGIRIIDIDMKQIFIWQEWNIEQQIMNFIEDDKFPRCRPLFIQDPQLNF